MLTFTKILVAISWALLLFTLISEPIDELGIYELTIGDKVVHFFLFGILALLIINALLDKKGTNFTILAALTFFITSAYAFAVEYWQQFVPGRFSDPLDSLAGIFGILIAIIFVKTLIYRKKPKLLLHICCAGCGAYVSQILKKDYRVTLYFYNPNIYPRQEFNQRLREVEKIAKLFKMRVMIKNYNHKAWLERIKGLEREPEGGGRCWLCYEDRLKKTAELAKDKKFDCFTSTLTVSPHKDAEMIIFIGKELEEKYEIKFLDRNFKAKDGFKKSVIISRGLGLYRQNYCGCEFSIRQ